MKQLKTENFWKVGPLHGSGGRDTEHDFYGTPSTDVGLTVGDFEDGSTATTNQIVEVPIWSYLQINWQTEI